MARPANVQVSSQQQIPVAAPPTSTPSQNSQLQHERPGPRSIAASSRSHLSKNGKANKKECLQHGSSSAAISNEISLDLCLAPSQAQNVVNNAHSGTSQLKRRSMNNNDTLNHERHLDADKLKFFLGTLASDYQVIASSAVGRSGGSAILFRSDISLVDWGADEQGRIVCGKFLCDHMELALVSIYAPNQPDNRKFFWHNLMSVFPQGNWIFTGDWNSVVSPDDSSSRSNVQGPDEALEFHNFCETFRLKDAREIATKREGPKFSRAQRRDKRFTWSRFDRFYTSQHSVQKIMHHSTFWNSDPIPISIVLGSKNADSACRENRQSAYFEADFRIVQENLGHLSELWKNLEATYSSGTAMERFLQCWAVLRAEIKRLQYGKSNSFAQLPLKEAELQRLLKIDRLALSAEEEERIGGLTAEIRAAQAWVHHR
ncbi:hypothetical protein R1sor_016183 [Riccia sorocarpa]|uniref:Endonuclease/exonuclease/phosphatase n=1 Tax=Riccia sorocarpa TaxID=122646 RepID=A0ABD3HIA7_9MARC